MSNLKSLLNSISFLFYGHICINIFHRKRFLDCSMYGTNNVTFSIKSQFSSKNTQYKNLEVYVYSYLGFSKKLFIISDITHSLLFDFPSFIKYIVCTSLFFFQQSSYYSHFFCKIFLVSHKKLSSSGVKMSPLQRLLCAFLVLFIVLSGTDGNILRHPRESVVYRTIFVDPSSKGNFTSIQSAIDSVPSNNNKWICIYIKAGIYR